jgi:hypothetical protein
MRWRWRCATRSFRCNGIRSIRVFLVACVAGARLRSRRAGAPEVSSHDPRSIKARGTARPLARPFLMCTRRCRRVAPFGAPSGVFAAPARALPADRFVLPSAEGTRLDGSWPSNLGQAGERPPVSELLAGGLSAPGTAVCVCANCVNLFARAPAPPECVLARPARGRRPNPHERRNRFASPQGIWRAGLYA